jgi:hypothetical protein
MSNSSMPDSQDPVLSGAMSSSLNDAAQHDRQELVQPFQSLTLEQKLSALTKASNGGEQGIALLNQGLEDADLRVRTEAYRQLKMNGYPSPVLERGIPLRVGDRIYAVYKSNVSYGDDLYYIHHNYDEDAIFIEDYSFYHKTIDSTGDQFEYVSDKPADNELTREDIYYHPSLVAYFVDQKIAEEIKDISCLEKFENLGCDIFQICPGAIDTRKSYQESIDFLEWSEGRNIKIEPEVWYDYEADEVNYEYEMKLIQILYEQKKFELLRELWTQLGYYPLAFVHDHLIDRPCYLKLCYDNP